MSATPIDSYCQKLEATARAASIAEDAYRRQAMHRIKELEQGRAFAFRRLNLIRAVAGAMAGSEAEAEALERGRNAFLREINFSGASESQREVAERFLPVLAALWQMQGEEASEAGAVRVEEALAAFEAWFAENRNGPFLSLMEAEVVELPLVEVC